MKVPYKYTVHKTVLQMFSEQGKRQREQLIRLFDFLAREPFVEGDTTQVDGSGRRCQVKRFGPWIVTYWPEHLANEIHILDVDRVG